ncbi:MAG: enoyl-CoA hydratase [Corynebacteriales bacterium]|nr:enoyl-CoA hydratase [Mycobacteriales bacterium]
MASLVQLHIAEGIARCLLDSPHNRNALSTQLITELTNAITTAVQDNSVRVIVLDHTGPVFCAGADLRESAAGGSPVLALPGLLTALWNSPKPTITVARGAARGGGLGLLAAADLAICASEATFAFSEVRVGVIAASIAPVVLAKLSPRAASELLLTGAVFDGRRAEEVGLVTSATDTETITEVVAQWTHAIQLGGPAALEGTKALLNADLSAEIADNAVLSNKYFQSAEAIEGMTAIREKRAPSWA